MELANVSLAFLAGLLSILSPCVLPLAPIVLAAAVSEHKLGALALAAGLVASYLALGLFVLTIGFSLGLDNSSFRLPGALLLVNFGVVLLMPRLQAQLALATSPMARWTEQRAGGVSRGGLGRQFGVGVLLGAVWSPCVGPTLGAALALAAQGHNLAHAALTMLAFATATVLPLLFLGLLSREAMMRWRSNLLSTGKGGKIALGS